MNAVVIPVTTPAGLNRGMALTQSVANVTNPNFKSNAFLLGQLTFATTGYGTSTIALQPSTLKIVRGATDLTSHIHLRHGQHHGYAACRAIANGDGLIEFAGLAKREELLRVPALERRQWPTTPTATALSTCNDLLNVKNFFGTGNGSGGGASAVPEPASLALMGLAGLALLATRESA